MRNGVLVAVFMLAAGIAETAPAKTKKEAVVPKLFCNARFVSVQTYEGDADAYASREYPADYEAAIGVRNRIQRWGRYTVVYPPQPPDLVLVVWKERKGGNRLPGQPTEIPPVGGPREPGSGTGPGAGQIPGQPGRPNQPGQGPGIGDGPGDVGISEGGMSGVFPVNDQLAVYTTFGDQTTSAPLWKHAQKDGLKEPDMPLFRRLADAVDDACSDQK